jgi:hypothetical protein
MEEKTIFAASALSFLGGIMNLLVSVIRLEHFPWFLTFISGVGIIIASIVLHVNLGRKALWGGIMFIYSDDLACYIIPEFAPIAPLAMFMIATTLMIIVHRKKISS